MKELIRTICTGLIDDEGVGSLVIDETHGNDENGSFTVYKVACPGYTGQLIGKQGRVANALRTVVKAAAMKHKRKVYIGIESDDDRKA